MRGNPRVLVAVIIAVKSVDVIKEEFD